MRGFQIHELASSSNSSRKHPQLPPFFSLQESWVESCSSCLCQLLHVAVYCFTDWLMWAMKLYTWSVSNYWYLRRHLVITPCLFRWCRSTCIHWSVPAVILALEDLGLAPLHACIPELISPSYMTSQDQFLLASATVPSLESSGPQLRIMVLVPCLCFVIGLDDDNEMKWGNICWSLPLWRRVRPRLEINCVLDTSLMMDDKR